MRDLGQLHIDLGIQRSLVVLEVLLTKRCGFGELFDDDLVTKIDTFIADINARASDQFLNLLLSLSAERALQQVASFADASHGSPLAGAGTSPVVLVKPNF